MCQYPKKGKRLKNLVFGSQRTCSLPGLNRNVKEELCWEQVLAWISQWRRRRPSQRSYILPLSKTQALLVKSVGHCQNWLGSPNEALAQCPRELPQQPPTVLFISCHASIFFLESYEEQALLERAYKPTPNRKLLTLAAQLKAQGQNWWAHRTVLDMFFKLQAFTLDCPNLLDHFCAVFWTLLLSAPLYQFILFENHHIMFNRVFTLEGITAGEEESAACWTSRVCGTLGRVSLGFYYNILFLRYSILYT